MTNDIARLHDLLNQSMELLDEAATLVEPSGVQPKQQSMKLIGLAIGEILNVRKFVYDTEPSLRED
ncbi:MAG: hypothetical protein AAGA44_09370 [Pseudomonadota bacterium]